MSTTVDVTPSLMQQSNTNSRSAGLHPISEDKETNQVIEWREALFDSSSNNSLSPTPKRRSLGTPYSSQKVKQILSEDYSEDNTPRSMDDNTLQLQEERKLKSIDAATLSDLVSELVHNTRKDPMFANYFLLASDYLATPADLIKRTIEFYSELSPRADESEQYSIKLRVVNTLSKILNLKPKSKFDSECLALVRQFADTLAMGNEVDKDLSSVLRRRIDTAVGKEDASPLRSRRKSLNSYSSLRSIKFDIIEDTARDIAEQFTLVCFSKFQAIPLDVLVKKKFEKETDANETPLGKFIGFFNDSSRWICTQIVMSTTEERHQRIAKFIMVMHELYLLNNFNGVMIFYSALNNAAIQKLIDKSLLSLPIEVISSFEEIKQLMDHRMNFKNYRAALEAASAPCIPYMALILRDLMHLEELDTIDEDQLVNWHKISHIGKILWKVSGYQSIAYEFEHIPHIQRGCTILSEQELFEMGKVVMNLGTSSDLLTSSGSNEILDDDEDVASDEFLVDAEVPNSLVSEGLYELPPWVLKREVVTTSGSIVEFDSVIANQTVLFVFLRHFGCIICRKSASELMMIKPQLDRLGVKLVAVGTGTWAQAKAFKDEFKFEGEIYVDEARHLYDDFRCQRGWIKGVLNAKTQALNAEARSLGYAQGPIQGDILQLGGAFILKNSHVMYEHIEKYAGDLADPIEILKRLGAGLDAVDEVYKRHPQLKPKQKQMRRKIRALEGKLKKVSKRLRSMSDSTPELLKLDTSSSPVLGRRRWYEKRKRSWSGGKPSLEYETDKEKEELVKKRQKYNQIKEKALILEYR